MKKYAKIDRNVKTESFKGLLKNSSFSMTSLNDMKKAGELADKALKNIKSSVKEVDSLYF